MEKKELKEKSKGLISEFKEFISRGNVLDLAVGVIIGGAFSNIVTAFTSILTDLLGAILGGINFKGLSFTVGKLTVNYGLFIQAVFDFLVIALCIFIFIKVINKVIRKNKEEEATETIKPENTQLLEEIRDLLKDQKQKKK